MHKFLKEDYAALIEKRDALVLQLRTSGKDIGEANRQSSETWHDNAPLDVAQRDFERLGRRLEEIRKTIDQAQVIQVGGEADMTVSIGSEVTFMNQKNEQQTLKIGSFIPAEGSDGISYDSPVGKILMGAQVGDVVEGTITGREVEFTIVSIRRWL